MKHATHVHVTLEGFCRHDLALSYWSSQSDHRLQLDLSITALVTI
jgi:hypothetical protein